MTVNLPGKMRHRITTWVRALRYLSLSDYCTALILWDVYSRQTHSRTASLMREPQWTVDGFVETLLEKHGERCERGLIKPYRFSVRVPDCIYPLAQNRIREEHYRSDSAYITGLVIYDIDLDVPAGKGIPHARLVSLMKEPKWLRDEVLKQLADDFGNPKRKWPKGVEGRIDDIRQRQLQLRS